MLTCGDDQDKALDLYKLNIQVSQALYPLLSVLEIALRNAIDRELSKYFQDNRWLLTQRHKFANHINLTRKDHKGNIVSDHFFTDKLHKAEEKLNFREVPIAHEKLLAELTFGFWIKFFDAGPIKILRGVPLQAFVNKPPIKLASVHSHLNSIVALRNRIAHSEPVCFDKSGKLCLQSLVAYEKNISDTLGWIDADLQAWTEKLNFFKPVYARIASI